MPVLYIKEKTNKNLTVNSENRMSSLEKAAQVQILPEKSFLLTFYQTRLTLLVGISIVLYSLINLAHATKFRKRF